MENGPGLMFKIYLEFRALITLTMWTCVLQYRNFKKIFPKRGKRCHES